MMTAFEIEIPNERKRLYDLITLIILALNFFGIGSILIGTHGPALQAFVVAVLVVAAVPAIYFLLNKKHLRTPVIIECFFILAVFWLLRGVWIFSVLILLFSLAGFLANRRLVIRINAGEVQYPSFPARTFLRKDIQNLMIRNNIITIDLKSNKLYQHNIIRIRPDISDAEFNKLYTDLTD